MESIPHELYEDARKRAKQKKVLFFHFVVFVLGSIFMYVSNEFLTSDPNAVKWYPWAIAVWTFLFLLHAINVLVVNRFMGKKWEREQIDKLVRKREKRIKDLQAKVEKEYPMDPTLDLGTNENADETELNP